MSQPPTVSFVAAVPQFTVPDLVRTAARLGQICGNEILDSKGSFEEQ
jgi:hypothetical protein